MDWLLLLAPFGLAAVFALAAVTKLVRRSGFRQAVADFGVAPRLVPAVTVLVPVLEAATAVALVLPSAATWGAGAAIGLLSLFTIAIAINVASGRHPKCFCFSASRSSPVGWRTMVRNGLLVVPAIIVLNTDETPYATVTADPSLVALFVVSAVLAVAVVAEGWFILNLLRLHGKMLTRLDALEGNPPTKHTAGPGQVVDSSRILTPSTGPVNGTPAPEFALRDLAGRTVGLSMLRELGAPVLLVFSEPGCTMCNELMPDIARWQAQHTDLVTIAVISAGKTDVNQRKASEHGLVRVLLQDRREVSQRYQQSATPSAVVVDEDGRIAGSEVGAEAIRGLMHHLVEHRIDRSHGRSQSTRSDQADGRGGHDALTRGDPAPTFTLPDSAGTPWASSDNATETLLVFYNPTCGHCVRLLPDLQAWELSPPADALRLVVISQASPGVAPPVLASTVLVDSSGEVMRAFGVRGTPMGIVIDASAQIGSGLLAGAPAIMDVLNAPAPDRSIMVGSAPEGRLATFASSA